MQTALTKNDIYFVGPREVYEQRVNYARLLVKVLENCYGKDYPGAALDITSNLSAITSKAQRSVFWAITKVERENEEFGTSSMVDASVEFGPGFAEMGKSGSLGKEHAKLGYIRFFEEWEKHNSFLKGFDTLVTTVRNCSERRGKEHAVRSGIGIRIIFLKYLHFEQWGVAPWFLMPDDSDGSYEMLDLLFQFRNKSEVTDYVKGNNIFLIGDSNKALLKQFANLNDSGVVCFGSFSNVDMAGEYFDGWQLLASKEKLDRNPVKLVPTDGGEPFGEVFKRLQKMEGAMKSVYVPLVSTTQEIQKLLEEEGWILTGFIPGRVSYGKSYPFKGMWSKLNTSRPLIKPDYLSRPDNLSPSWYFEFVRDQMQRLKSNSP